MRSHQPGRPLDEDVERVIDQFGVAGERATALPRTHLPVLRRGSRSDAMTRSFRLVADVSAVKVEGEHVGIFNLNLFWRRAMLE
jgi:hypothetical protein